LPFVQGLLRREALSFAIQTECKHCGRPIHLELDTDLRYHVVEAEAAPLVYVPMVDIPKLKEPSIVDRF
jgi:hypothetical protein